MVPLPRSYVLSPRIEGPGDAAFMLSFLSSPLALRTPALPQASRRDCLAAGLTAAALPILGQPTVAAADDELIDVYFGCGCFWHVQHELLRAEREVPSEPG